MGTKLLRGAVALLLGIGLIAPLASQNALAADKKAAESHPPLKLKVGDKAPDFSLLAFDGHSLKKIALSDYKGKKDVVLAFYVFAFTGG